MEVSNWVHAPADLPPGNIPGTQCTEGRSRRCCKSEKYLVPTRIWSPDRPNRLRYSGCMSWDVLQASLWGCRLSDSVNRHSTKVPRTSFIRRTNVGPIRSDSDTGTASPHRRGKIKNELEKTQKDNAVPKSSCDIAVVERTEESHDNFNSKH